MRDSRRKLQTSMQAKRTGEEANPAALVAAVAVPGASGKATGTAIRADSAAAGISCVFMSLDLLSSMLRRLLCVEVQETELKRTLPKLHSDVLPLRLLTGILIQNRYGA